MNRNSNTYSLCSTERRFKDNTLISYYFKPNKKIIKKCSPIDIDGERYRFYHETGEIENYTKKDILACRDVSVRRTRIAMNMLLMMNDFEWFWTLTFDKEKIDRTNDKQVFNCYKKYINNIKHKYSTFKYMCFPERHEDNCVHFHLLVAGLSPKQMGLVNSGKVCCHWAMKKTDKNFEKLGYCSKEFYEKTKDQHELTETDGEPIYNISNFAYGFTTVSRICSRERCNSYVKKYVDKALGSTEIFKKRFYYSSNLNIPSVVKHIISPDFEKIEKIDKLDYIKQNNYVEYSSSQYMNEDYNVLQVKIENRTKDLLDCGFAILTNKQTKNLDDIF